MKRTLISHVLDFVILVVIFIITNIKTFVLWSILIYLLWGGVDFLIKVNNHQFNAKIYHFHKQ